MTAQELLNTKLDGHSTLEDVFNSHRTEGQFGYDASVDEPEFFLQLAQKIIDAVTATEE